MSRFDIYVNPNKAAQHALYVDVQSDSVQLSTRLCIPMRLRTKVPLIQGARHVIKVNKLEYVLDTPNLLAVPAVLLRQHAGRLSSTDQLLTESCMEFMLRGY